MILASFLLFLNLNVGASDVQVQILSKHLRIIREAGSGSLDIRIPAVHIIRDGVEYGILSPGVMRLVCRQGHFFIIDTTGREMAGREIKIEPAGDTDEWHTTLESRERSYPLPLCIRQGNGDPVITINENISRYCLDSAIAEYGIRDLSEQEAVYALAHLIRARCLDAQRFPHHGQIHFCDLTHCQVYQGRLSSHGMTDLWDIQTEKEKTPFLFHACCGGQTLGPSVFNYDSKGRGVRDIIVSTGEKLCGKDQSWQRRLTLAELSSDLELDRLKKIIIKRNDYGISIISGNENKLLPLETFRLAVNRKHGWSFLRSNTYSLRILGGFDGPEIEFSGRGLGHGVGFCQEGALELSRRGFSRYEILCHYYPEMIKICNSRAICPELSWCSFDLETGKITGGDKFVVNRLLPPGSLAKLLVALYMAQKRPDLFQNYMYSCSGKWSVNGKTIKCWKSGGHGDVDIESALTHSCNLYFCSLSERIDRVDLNRFSRDLLSAHKFLLSIPVTDDPFVFGQRLAGLDFNIKWQVKDIVSLGSYLSKITALTTEGNCSGEDMTRTPSAMIMKALQETFTEGTASGRENSKAYMCLLPPDDKDLDIAADSGVYWGKTSTVIHGTNDPLSYGIFIGGDRTRGIVAILRGGNGHCAARWGLHLLAGFCY